MPPGSTAPIPPGTEGSAEDARDAAVTRETSRSKGEDLMTFRNRMQITIGPAVLSRRQCVLLGRTKTFLWPVQSGGFQGHRPSITLFPLFPEENQLCK